MGPPLFRGGHWDEEIYERLEAWRLQWGHLSLEVVINIGHVGVRVLVLASMGPPLFRGGHCDTMAAVTALCRGFNGATSL